MTFAAVTTTAVVGGTVFLMGTSAPVDEVTLDGVAVPARTVMALPTDFPERGAEYSVIVSLPPEAASGAHQLRVARGDEAWTTELTLVSAPAPRAVTFAAVTTTAVVGGTVFLMGTSAPVDAVTLDGVAVPAKGVMALPTDFPEPGAEYSVIVSLPPGAASGSHELRVSRGSAAWTTELTLVSEPAPKRAERGATCGRQAMDRPLRAYIAAVWWVDVVRDGRLDPVSDQPAGVGLVVLDGVRLFVVPDNYSFFVPIADRPPSSRLVQAIYPDGTIGDRWSIDCEAHGFSNSYFGTKLSGGAVPLWVSRDPIPDPASSIPPGAGPPPK